MKQPTEKPLSWYNAPKSEKRVKLTEDPEVEVQPFRENKKRGMSLLKEKNKGVTPKVPEKPEPVSSEVDDGEVCAYCVTGTMYMTVTLRLTHCDSDCM